MDKERKSAHELEQMITARMTISAHVSVVAGPEGWVVKVAPSVDLGAAYAANAQAQKIASELRAKYDLLV